MTLGELLNDARHAVLRDSVAPALWPDTLLARYFNEAETIFARRTHCLTSDDAPFCTLTTEAGKAKYALSPSIIYIMEVVDEIGVPVRLRGRNRVPVSAIQGKPRVYTADTAYKGLRLYPEPDDVYTLTMNVAHKPTKKMAHAAQKPEIPEEYHSALIDFVVYRALLNNGPEGGDTTAAGPFKAEWELALRDAKRDSYHMRNSPNAAVVNNWTGGRN